MTHSPRYNTTRLDLAQATARASGMPVPTCDAVIQEFFNVVATALKMGHMVQLRGAMTFYARTRVARPARNPRTGEVVMLPRRQVALCRWPTGRV